jgi:hypothetical protein
MNTFNSGAWLYVKRKPLPGLGLENLFKESIPSEKVSPRSSRVWWHSSDGAPGSSWSMHRTTCLASGSTIFDPREMASQERNHRHPVGKHLLTFEIFRHGMLGKYWDVLVRLWRPGRGQLAELCVGKTWSWPEPMDQRSLIRCQPLLLMSLGLIGHQFCESY